MSLEGSLSVCGHDLRNIQDRGRLRRRTFLCQAGARGTGIPSVKNAARDAHGACPCSTPACALPRPSVLTAPRSGLHERVACDPLHPSLTSGSVSSTRIDCRALAPASPSEFDLLNL